MTAGTSATNAYCRREAATLDITRCGEVWYLGRLITFRSRVRIPPPLQKFQDQRQKTSDSLPETPATALVPDNMTQTSQTCLPLIAWEPDSPMGSLCEDLADVLKETCPGDAAWVGSDSEDFLKGAIPSDLMIVLFTPGGASPSKMPASECRAVAALTDAAVWRFPIKSSILGNRHRKEKLGEAIKSLVSYSMAVY